jgi:hypothetical protein
VLRIAPPIIKGETVEGFSKSGNLDLDFFLDFDFDLELLELLDELDDEEELFVLPFADPPPLPPPPLRRSRLLVLREEMNGTNMAKTQENRGRGETRRNNRQAARKLDGVEYYIYVDTHAIASTLKRNGKRNYEDALAGFLGAGALVQPPSINSF